MPLAFRAEKLLQKAWASPSGWIKFLNVFTSQVRDALRRRGESWRIARLPTFPSRHRGVRASLLGSLHATLCLRPGQVPQAAQGLRDALQDPSCDDRGCFADRWRKVLERLDRTDLSEVAGIIEASFQVGIGR